ncbi:hypothetical protein [Rhizobium rhizogenes]|uniref:hypothetical protein n=1 Tax=Rhizobium rhizogenes TaxID=359 RepID=UPI001297CC68|nr:hypothetical protein [Rhizobium rhizogenes]
MGILFGEDAIDFIHPFSVRLKERTRLEAERRDNQAYPAYSPWLCARPKLSGPIDPELLAVSFPKGGLVTNERQLGLVQRYVDGQGHILMENMPVAPQEWPIMVNIERERPDAISAFEEGMALLKASPFLTSVYDDLVDFVIPQDRERASGFDSGYARGVIFRTFPKGRGGLLAGFQIAHAMGHHAAILLQAADPLIASDPEAEIYYKVRKDRRSANHAIVSSVALGYMVVLMKDLYRNQPRPFIADDHIRGYSEYLPDAVQLAVSSITDACELTPVGTQIITELAALN